MSSVTDSLQRPPAVPTTVSGTGSTDRNGSGGANQVTLRPRQASSTGITIGLCAIAMYFAALSSALIVRKASGDWKHIALPSLLYLNTFILAGSSLTLEMARRRVATFMRSAGTSVRHPRLWLEATLALGLAFLGGQLVVWRQLAERGFYVATNPSSSFFYVLTGGHALHIFGGLFGLLLVLHRLSGPIPTLRKSTMDVTAYYWHFMGVLWIYLLLLLRFQL
jgi:cytochrome c oxidase subunit III